MLTNAAFCFYMFRDRPTETIENGALWGNGILAAILHLSMNIDVCGRLIEDARGPENF